MNDVERTARDRAALYLYAAELAAVRGDEDAADEAELRAWELLDPFGRDFPARGWGADEHRVFGEPRRWYYPDPESFDPDRAAGPDESREMLSRVRDAWSRAEDAALQTLQLAKKAGRGAPALKVLRSRWRSTADAIERLTRDRERCL